MRPNEIIKEIDNLSLSEKLILVEDIWDSIARNNAELPLPEWHRDILEERKRKIKTGKAEFISLEELKASRKS
jgi:putative addiction module component (TIGR02574 family)